MSKFAPTSRSNPCPICDDTKGKCRHGNRGDGYIQCMSFAGAHSAPNGWHFLGDTKCGTWGQFVPALQKDDRHTQEWEAQKAERQRRAEEQRQKELFELSQALPVDERSAQNRKFLLGLDLDGDHLENLRARGLSDRQIKSGLFKSIAPRQPLKSPISPRLAGVARNGKSAWVSGRGILCPAFDIHGRITGMQLRLDDGGDGGKYRWLKSQFGSKLPNGEMPLTVVKPEGEVRRFGLCEGIMKPDIAATLSSDTLFIGASGGNFKTSRKQLEETLRWARREYGEKPVAFYPDAGALENPQVLKRDRNTIRLLEKLGRKIGFELEVADWGQEFDKAVGDIDELLAAGRGDEIEFVKTSKYHRLAQKAEALNRYRELNQLSIAPKTLLNQPELGKLPLPKPRTITAVSSACKTGKTAAIEHWCDRHRTDYPNGKIFLVGYRNALIRQTSRRTGIQHVQDLAIGQFGLDATYLKHSREIGLCLDSLFKIDPDKIPAHSLVILDEGEAVLKHGLEGGTLGSDQAKILDRFQENLNRVLELGGAIAILEDSLSDLSLNLLRDATGGKYPIELTQNTYQASHWEVEIGGGSSSGFVARILAALGEGQKIFVPTTSQIFGEILEWVVRSLLPQKKVIRLDAETVENSGDLMESPDEVLGKEKPDLFIGSPTIESGLSFWIELFDAVYGFSVSLETRAQLQHLERCRLNIPRFIYASDFLPGDDGNGRGFDPNRIHRNWQICAKHTAKLSQIEPDKLGDKLDRPGERGKLWNYYAARFKARTNAAQSALRDNLKAALISRGHQVSERQWEKDAEIAELLKRAKTEIEARKARELHESEPGDMQPDEAKRILKSQTSKREKRLKAKKCLLADKLPGAKLTEDFILKAVVENRGRFLRSTELLWMVENPEIASILDKKAMEKAAVGPFIMLRRFSHHRLKADLIRAHRQLLELTDGREYREGDSILQEVREIALNRAGEIWRVLGLCVKPEHSAVTIANKFLKRLGFDAMVARKEGGRGKQERIWKVDLSTSHVEHRETILTALTRKLAPLLGEAESFAEPTIEGIENPVVTTSKLETTRYIKVVTTVVEALHSESSSPKWKGLRGRAIEAIPDLPDYLRSRWEDLQGLTLVVDCEPWINGHDFNRWYLWVNKYQEDKRTGCVAIPCDWFEVVAQVA